MMSYEQVYSSSGQTCLAHPSVTLTAAMATIATRVRVVVTRMRKMVVRPASLMIGYEKGTGNK